MSVTLSVWLTPWVGWVLLHQTPFPTYLQGPGRIQWSPKSAVRKSQDKGLLGTLQTALRSLWTSGSRRRWCKGVVDGVEVLLMLLTTLLSCSTWASASVLVSVIAEGTKGFSL